MYNQCRYNVENAMIAKIRKWGNSLALRIPKSMAGDVHMTDGSAVDLLVKDEALVVRPVRAKVYRLDALLGQVKSGNIHKEIGLGDPVGRELI